jgi:hypothetical protein
MLLPLPTPFPNTTTLPTAELGTSPLGNLPYFPPGTDLALGQLLEDLSNHTHFLTTPNFIPELLIKTTEIILAKSLSKWTNESNGFVDMLSIELTFCQEPQGVFASCETSFSQCLHPTWTDTCAVECSAPNKDIALNHVSHCPNHNGNPNQEGHSTYLPFN